MSAFLAMDADDQRPRNILLVLDDRLDLRDDERRSHAAQPLRHENNALVTPQIDERYVTMPGDPDNAASQETQFKVPLWPSQNVMAELDELDEDQRYRLKCIAH